jgi:hypothetical protein
MTNKCTLKKEFEFIDLESSEEEIKSFCHDMQELLDSDLDSTNHRNIVDMQIGEDSFYMHNAYRGLHVRCDKKGNILVKHDEFDYTVYPKSKFKELYRVKSIYGENNV